MTIIAGEDAEIAQRQDAKRGLFEMVKEVAIHLGTYSKGSLPDWLTVEAVCPLLDEHGLNKKYTFQNKGLKLVAGFWEMGRGKLTRPVVYVETNNTRVFEAYLIPEASYLNVVSCASGSWETRLQEFYYEAICLKAARGARKDTLRQRIRAAGDKRSASIF